MRSSACSSREHAAAVVVDEQVGARVDGGRLRNRHGREGDAAAATGGNEHGPERRNTSGASATTPWTRRSDGDSSETIPVQLAIVGGFSPSARRTSVTPSLREPRGERVELARRSPPGRRGRGTCAASPSGGDCTKAPLDAARLQALRPARARSPRPRTRRPARKGLRRRFSARVSRVGCSGDERAHFDERRALAQHVELGRGGVRKVDDAVRHERPAVVDAHDDALAVAQVRHARVGGQRQRLVSGASWRTCRTSRPSTCCRRGRWGRTTRRRRARRSPSALEQHEIALAEHFVERRIAALAARLDRAARRPGSR